MAALPEPPFRATISSLTPDGVGELAFEGGKLKFGASACQGFRPAMGLEVEVLAMAPHVLGGRRPSSLRLLTDQATYERLLNAAVEAFERQPKDEAASRVEMVVAKPVAKLELPELATPPPAGHRYVVVVRFTNKRDDLVFVREVTWDGRLLRARAYQEGTTPDIPITMLMKDTTKYDDPETARRALESEVTTHSTSFELRTHVVKTLPIPRVLKLASDSALEKAFVESPASKKGEAARALADWLQTQGDARGELAPVFQQKGDAAALEFLENHEGLLGEVSHALGEELHSLKWSHGFVTGVSLVRAHRVSRTTLQTLTRDFLASPLARFVTDLRFGLASFGSDNDWSQTLREVVESVRGPFIERLDFDHFTYEDCALSSTPFGDFSPYWSRLPRLEHLHLRSGAGGVLGDIELPSLKTFIRESSGLARDELRCILKANWPKLERLDLWFGSKHCGAEGSVELIQPLLDAQGPTRLKHLGLVNCEFSDELLPAILKSKILPKLEVLDLSLGLLSDEDVELLLKHAGKLKHLERLDLSENLLEESGPRLEAVLPNVILGEQRASGNGDDGDDGDDDDDDDRYSDVSE